MRKRILTIVSAAVISVMLLTGCSGDFKSSSIVNAAKKNGMQQMTSEELKKRFEGESYSADEPYENSKEPPAYYVANDSEEATYIQKTYLSTDSNNAVFVKELVIFGGDECIEGFLMVAGNEDDATRLYNEWGGNFDGYDNVKTAGARRGMTYTTGHYSSDTNMYRTSYYGVYLKGRSVLVISYGSDTAEERNKLESFCKNLGVISPLTEEK